MKKTIQFQITFSQDWVFSRRDDLQLPADWLAAELQRQFQVNRLSTSITGCEGELSCADPGDLQQLKDQLDEIIANKYGVGDGRAVYTISVKEVQAVPEDAPAPEGPATAKQPDATPPSADIDVVTRPVPGEAKPAPQPKADRPSAYDRIMGLIGVDEFKELARECSRLAEGLLRNDVVDALLRRTYIISVNDGCGLTTYLELFADLLEELGLFRFQDKKTAEVRLEPPGEKTSSNNPFGAASSLFSQFSQGRVVCIDISEWMGNLKDKAFRDFLQKIDDSPTNNIVFFRVPFIEKTVLENVWSCINDVLFVKSLSVVPFSSEELLGFAGTLIEQKHFEMAEDAWDVFVHRINAEKSDGKFYGINTIRKIVMEMFLLKQISDSISGTPDMLIKADDIRDLAQNEMLPDSSGFSQLDALVGMEKVRARIEEIVAQIEASMSNDSLDTPCIHMRFVGNPGTGKTTVARILGTILKEKGILRNGNFFEFTGRDLCGRYVGETAPKTAGICRDAYGSVLFIDEAYSLYRDDGFSRADYGREAIDTLVAEMENHRTDLVVIMAGYTDDMEKLMNANVGLKSRMPYLVEFPNYDREQLAAIFLRMAERGFAFNEAFRCAVRDYFAGLPDAQLQAKEFSNARFVRNLYERTWGKAALRCQLDGRPCDTLTVEDFRLASADSEFLSGDGKKNPIGF